RNPLDADPFTWARYRQPRFLDYVGDVLVGRRFDLIHCDHVQVAHALEGFAASPRVLNAHNLEHVLVRRAAQRSRHGFRRAIIGWQAAKTEDAERRIYQTFDRCLAVSEKDASEIRRLAPHTPVSVVPNGVDLTYFTPHADASAPHIMVFTGAMDWLPNV